PDAGNLLTVGSGDVSFLLHNPNYQLYVRKCYPDLFYALYESTSKKHVVTGTPGIGKSYFFYYMLLRLLHSPSPPPFILWEHYGFPGVMWCYMHETGQVQYSSNGRVAFLEAFRNPETWWVLAAQCSTLIVCYRVPYIHTPVQDIQDIPAISFGLAFGRGMVGIYLIAFALAGFCSVGT
ncbi:hypothetical protein VOLCADRAFT_101311, partial [Volvox carteri f. nagariensis]